MRYCQVQINLARFSQTKHAPAFVQGVRSSVSEEASSPSPLPMQNIERHSPLLDREVKVHSDKWKTSFLVMSRLVRRWHCWRACWSNVLTRMIFVPRKS
ncbi:putative DNA-binding domain protein [Burkholderia pseudomallei ABCPW 107]|nr:putative DNA-binding domain protein [Burkholderia pseudomallei ABCPW 107]